MKEFGWQIWLYECDWMTFYTYELIEWRMLFHYFLRYWCAYFQIPCMQPFHVSSIEKSYILCYLPKLEVGSESIKIPWSHSLEAYQSLIAALFVKRSINCGTLWLRVHFSSFWWRFGPRASLKIKISTSRRSHGLRQTICWFYLILIPWVTCPKHQLGFRS